MSGPARVGAAAAILTAAAALALWWSGFIPAFGRNRGLLQVTVAIPVTCALAGFWARAWTRLDTPALALAPVPLGVLTIAVGIAMDVEIAALPALLALAGTAAVPWWAGVTAGAWWSRRRAREPEPPDPS